MFRLARAVLQRMWTRDGQRAKGDAPPNAYLATSRSAENTNVGFALSALYYHRWPELVVVSQSSHRSALSQSVSECRSLHGPYVREVTRELVLRIYAQGIPKASTLFLSLFRATQSSFCSLLLKRNRFLVTHARLNYFQTETLLFRWAGSRCSVRDSSIHRRQ